MELAPTLQDRRVDGIDLLTDEGARERGILVVFTNRRGGVSASPYDSLNLALRVGDDRVDVTENRARAAGAAGFCLEDLALTRQVHGTDVMEVSPGHVGVLGEADGLVVRSAGPVLGILTADCAPVVVAGKGGIAILHAGWRGLASGVIEAGVGSLGPVWAAWVGPAIRACCYEVGREVVDAFRYRGLPVAGKSHVDPGAAARRALERAGVKRIAASERCTSCESCYFSYRRDGVTGRQGAFASLLEAP